MSQQANIQGESKENSRKISCWSSQGTAGI